MSNLIFPRYGRSKPFRFYLPSFQEIMEVSRNRGRFSEAPELWHDLVGAWPCQEGGGVPHDTSGNNAHASLNNSPVWEITRFGRGMQSIRTGSHYIILPSKTLTDPATFAFWVNYIAIESYSNTIGDAGATADYWAARSSNNLTMQADGNWSNWSFVWATGTWYYVVMRLNGVWEAIIDCESLGTQLGGSFDISSYGAGYSGAAGADAHLGPLMIWDRAITDSEIADSYAKRWAMYRLRKRYYPGISVGPVSIIGTIVQSFNNILQTTSGDLVINCDIGQLIDILIQSAGAGVPSKSIIIQTLDTLQQNLNASFVASGNIVQLLQLLSQDADASVNVIGNINQLFSELSQSVGATVSINISIDQAISAIIQSASASGVITSAGDIIQILSQIQQIGESNVNINIDISQLFAQLNQSLDSNISVEATAIQTFAKILQSAGATSVITSIGNINQVLEKINQSSDGSISIDVNISQILSQILQSSTSKIYADGDIIQAIQALSQELSSIVPINVQTVQILSGLEQSLVGTAAIISIGDINQALLLPLQSVGGNIYIGGGIDQALEVISQIGGANVTISGSVRQRLYSFLQSAGVSGAEVEQNENVYLYISGLDRLDAWDILRKNLYIHPMHSMEVER